MTRRAKRHLPVLVLSLLFLLARPAAALPERPVTVGLALGVPELLAVEGTVLAIPKRIQLGFGYGMDGGFTSTLFPEAKSFLIRVIVSRDIPFADGNVYRVDPSVDPVGIAMWTPFVRVFPTDRNFYFQLTWAMLRMGTEFSSKLVDPSTGNSLDGVVTGSVKFVQQIPTLALGHVFMSKAFFVDVRIGAAIMFTSSVAVDLKAAIPSNLGGTEANAAALKSLTQQLEDLIIRGATDIKKQVDIIPSFVLSFGIIL